MDDTQINITVNKRFIERLVYWLVILVLLILLIVAWTNDPEQPAETAQAGETTGTAQQDTAAEETAPPVEAVAEASCSDAELNQDETDIDCGGSCTKCALTRACEQNSDCISGICHNSTCVSEKPVTLSGDLELDLTKIETTEAASGAVKVAGISYTIKNGLAEEFDGFVARIYVKNKAGTRCLNQQVMGTCDDSYAELVLGSLASGKTMTKTQTFTSDEYTTKSGSYLIDDSGQNPTSFQVVMFLYDEHGNEIDGKTISDAYTKG